MEEMILAFINFNKQSLTEIQLHQLKTIAAFAGESDGHFDKYSKALDKAMEALKMYAPQCEEYKELVAYFDGY